MIKIKRLHELATFEKAHDSDIGYDLTCCDVSYDTEHGLWEISLGVAVEPPNGYYFQLVPRSSFPKTGLAMANSIGIIDPTYRGEWIMKCFQWNAFGTIDIVGKKVAQAVLCKQYDGSKDWGSDPHPFFNWVEELNETERGGGGFGSTDK